MHLCVRTRGCTYLSRSAQYDSKMQLLVSRLLLMLPGSRQGLRSFRFVGLACAPFPLNGAVRCPSSSHPAEVSYVHAVGNACLEVLALLHSSRATERDAGASAQLRRDQMSAQSWK